MDSGSLDSFRGLLELLGQAHHAGAAGIWDLIDVDVEGGAELDIFDGDLTELESRVRRLHISTHRWDIHRLLLERFRSADWTIPSEFRPVSIVTFGEHGPLVSMDGHFTAFPPQRSRTWSLW